MAKPKYTLQQGAGGSNVLPNGDIDPKNKVGSQAFKDANPQSTTDVQTGSSNPSTDQSKPQGGIIDQLGKPSDKNDYYDANKPIKPQEIKPSEDTSSGAQAAAGTDYSWITEGTAMADNKYQQDKLKAKQDALANAQTLNANAAQYQQQADMMQYQSNQNAEKVGWTGGYVLDQARQDEYMKQTIQAQLYGAMELQKMGYDSALAAARLSYDLNQKEFSHKYYNDALNQAIALSNITGFYISPEAKEMTSQAAVADAQLPKELQGLSADEIDAKLKDGSYTLTEEQQRALGVKRSTDNWFKSNHVSKGGQKIYQIIQQERDRAIQYQNQLWEKYTAAEQNARANLKPNEFIQVDEQGNPMYVDGKVQTGSWKTMSGEDIINYIQGEGKDSNQRSQQFLGYLDQNLSAQVGVDFQKWAENKKKPLDADSLQEFLNTDDKFANFINTKFKDVEDKDLVAKMLDGYTTTLQLPDGEIEYTLHQVDGKYTGVKNPTKPEGGGKPEEHENLVMEDKETAEDVIGEFNSVKEFENIMDDYIKNTAIKYNVHAGLEEASEIINEGGPLGALLGLINDQMNAGKNKEALQSLEVARKSMLDVLGEHNINLIKAKTKELNNMSERDKKLLIKSGADKELYDTIAKYGNSILKIEDTINELSKRDSALFGTEQSAFEHTGDVWRQTGDLFKDGWDPGDTIKTAGKVISNLGTSIMDFELHILGKGWWWDWIADNNK